MLNNIMLADQEFILSRYKTILKKNNILTVRDILFNFPSKYDDYTITPHSEITSLEQDRIVLEGSVSSKINVAYLKSKMTTVTFSISVEKGNGETINVRCTLFNRAFLKDKLKLKKCLFYKHLESIWWSRGVVKIRHFNSYTYHFKAL